MPNRRQMDDLTKGKIIALSQEKKSTRAIAAIVGYGQSTVVDFLRKFRHSGSVARKIGSGRVRKTTAAQDRLIRRSCIQDRFKSSSAIKKDLKDATGVEVDASTVRRRLREAGLNGRRPAKKPFLTQNMRKQRYEWAKQHKDWTVEQWKSVIFSDESKFNIFGSDGIQHVWRRSGERFSEQCIQTTVRQSVNRMVWGCFSYNGIKKIHLIDGRVNGEVYIQILERHLIPCIEEQYQHVNEVIFQDDSAPCHRSHIVRNFMSKNGITQLPWPGNSPDLNPIENLWAIMKKQVAAQKPNSHKKLDEILINTWWDDLDTGLLQALISSMPARISAVLKAKGGATKY